MAQMVDTRFIDDAKLVAETIDAIEGLLTSPPSLYFDLEGENLSRNGTISILQLYVLPFDRTYILDVHTLRSQCFSTAGKSGHTLRDILEDGAIPKVFFDIRNDSDALYSLFGINVNGIHDLQLMELATRTFERRVVSGLSKCIERDAPLTIQEQLSWKANKERGVKLFAPERGGSYQVFNERPLRPEIMTYCAQDVKFLSRLWSIYDSRLTPEWRQRVLHVSGERVKESQSLGFVGQGRHMALAPHGWKSL